MPKKYTDASDMVADLAADIIAQKRPELQECEFAFVFVTNYDKHGFMKYPKPNKHGKVTLGQAKCFSASDRAAGCPDFSITLLYNWWEKADATQQRALMYHELRHCGAEETDDGTQLMSVPHNFEGFDDELALFGPWTRDLKSMQAQLQLFDGDGTVPEHDAETGEVRPNLELLEAVRDLCPEGEGMTVTLSSKHYKDGKPVVLTSETRQRVEEQIAAH